MFMSHNYTSVKAHFKVINIISTKFLKIFHLISLDYFTSFLLSKNTIKIAFAANYFQQHKELPSPAMIKRIISTKLPHIDFIGRQKPIRLQLVDCVLVLDGSGGGRCKFFFLIFW